MLNILAKEKGIRKKEKKMKNLLKRIYEISKKHEQLAKLSGNNYNVFKIINVTTNEVRLHSRFISELLNPKGSHGQGDIFLNFFTQRFGINMNTKSAKVEIEKHIGLKTKTKGGILDIFISDNKGHTIIIENKIYAPDQENQIVRYHNYSRDNVFYLTLFKDKPSKSSYGNLEIDKDFKLISYESDIIEWLTECRKEAVELPLLREGISHYINLVKLLTGQSNNNVMNKEIQNYITSTSENLKTALLIEENLINAKIEIQWIFWEKLKEMLIEKGLKYSENKCVSLQNVKNYYKKGRNRDKYYGLWFEVYKKGEISIHFGIEIENQIYYGFTIERKGKRGISLDDDNKVYRDIVSEIDNKYKSSKYWLGWKYLKKNLDFRAFNSDAIFHLANNSELNKQIENIVIDISNDINILNDKLTILKNN